MRKVYMVMFDWSTSDDSAVEVELFDTYKKAFKRKGIRVSWVADAFDCNGEIKDGYEFVEHIPSDGTNEYDCWWNIMDKNDWHCHDFFDLKVMEVK